MFVQNSINLVQTIIDIKNQIMPKEPPKKKQKISRNDNHNKKSIIERTKISNGSFASLFLYDWFLIELGRKLIGPVDDRDLINILCLCREIYEKATIIFGQHFLNFDLQKQILALTKKKDLNEIQTIFVKNGLALNPNIEIVCWEISSKNKNSKHTPKQKLLFCTHDENLKKYFPPLLKCECALKHTIIPLVVMATRLVGMDSLVKAILFHHRFRFSHFKYEDHSMEISNWAVVNGHWDVIERLFEVICGWSQRKNSSEFEITVFISQGEPIYLIPEEIMASHFDWTCMFVSAILYSRFEILKKIIAYLNYYEGADFWPELFDTSMPYLQLCSLLGQEEGSKYFDFVLNSPFCQFDDLHSDAFNSILLECCSYGIEFVRVCVKNLLHVASFRSFEYVPDSVNKTMKLLCSGSTNNDNEFLAIKFAFGNGLENDFRSLFMEREWNDQELVKLLVQYPLQKFKERQVRCFELIWKNLSAGFKFEESDVELILVILISMKSYQLLKMVWNDKRVMMTPQDNNKFVLENANKLDLELLKISIPKCDLSDLSTPHRLNLDETLDFRSILFLQFCFDRTSLVTNLDNFKTILDMLEIKWNENLFSLFLRDPRLSCFIMIWLLRSESIERTWWTTERIQHVLKQSFKNRNDGGQEVFDELLKKFPNFDLNLNNHELIKIAIVERRKLMLKKLLSIPTIRLRDQQEREELCQLALDKTLDSKSISILSKVPLFNEQSASSKTEDADSKTTDKKGKEKLRKMN